MEAGAPTPSLTPYIIDYARLQISSEKEPKTLRQRKREREGEQIQKDVERGEISEGRLSSLNPHPALKQQ